MRLKDYFCYPILDAHAPSLQQKDAFDILISQLGEALNSGKLYMKNFQNRHRLKRKN